MTCEDAYEQHNKHHGKGRCYVIICEHLYNYNKTMSFFLHILESMTIEARIKYKMFLILVSNPGRCLQNSLCKGHSSICCVTACTLKKQ